MRQAINRVLDYQIVPAPPGFKAWTLSRAPSHHPRPEHPEPIIGWCYYRLADGQGGFTWRHHPITTADACPGADGWDYIIEYPDGRVRVPFVETFADMDQALAFLKEDAEKAAAMPLTSPALTKPLDDD